MLRDDLDREDRWGWEGGLRRRGYVYTYRSFTYLYSRNQRYCKATISLFFFFLILFIQYLLYGSGRKPNWLARLA